MPKLSAGAIVGAIVEAASDSGGVAALTSRAGVNPRKFVVQFGQSIIEIWAYVWTLTHGGYPRDANEYRIQMTGVSPPLAMNLRGPTILIGYEPNLQCFAGFDIRKHRRFTPGSPSIQINIGALHDAMRDGLSFFRKGNDEIAIGFRPDQFVAYAANSVTLHTHGADAKLMTLMSKAVALERISKAEVKKLPEKRQRILETISRLSRDSSFQRKVKVAYDYRCAVTRAQLQLIDAAHILPVGVEGSDDDVVNGLCLSPTFHRAYDRALIYLDEKLTMRINPERERELASAGRIGGLSAFKVFLGKQIHLPPDKKQWPNINMIRKANVSRGIPR